MDMNIEYKCTNVVAIKKIKRSSGVYVFLNIVKKMAYVGQTTEGAWRIDEHLRSLFIETHDERSNGTNVNLRDEDTKTFEVLFYPIKSDTERLLDYETALMCICRKKGLLLYNGDKKHERDDLQGKRKALLSLKEKVDADEYWNKTWINERVMQEKEKKGLCEELEKIYSFIEKEFKLEWDAEESEIEIEDILEKEVNDRIAIWEERVKMFKEREGEYLLINSNGKIDVPARLTYKDMNDCNVIGKSLKEILDVSKADLDYSVWSNFGLYLTQGPKTILKTKCHDINNMYLRVDNNGERVEVRNNEGDRTENDGKGICFWSLQSRTPDFVRKKLAKWNGKEELYRGPRLLFLPYTTSTKKIDITSVHLGMEILEDEDIKKNDKYLKRLNNLRRQGNGDIFADGYIYKNVYQLFPKNMFPIITSMDRTKMAFLISNIYYVKGASKETINTIKKSFTAIYEKADDKSLSKVRAGENQASCILTRSNLNELNENCILEPKDISNEEETKLLVAILEYPYIVGIDHVPPLNIFLCRGNREIENGEAPRIIFETENNVISRKQSIVRIYAFMGNDVWFQELPTDSKYDNYVDCYNKDILKKMEMAGCNKGTYSVETNDEISRISIKTDENKYIYISFEISKEDVQPICRRIKGREGWDRDYGIEDRYYGFNGKICFEDSDTALEHFFAFRHFSSNGKPPFVLA